MHCKIVYYIFQGREVIGFYFGCQDYFKIALFTSKIWIIDELEQIRQEHSEKILGTI